MVKKTILLFPLTILFVVISASTATASEWVNTAAADSVKIYEVVDQMPEVEGGIQEVYKHIKYPQAAVTRRIEGRVFIKFIVDENGKVKNPEVVKDIGSGCGDAAIDGIKKVKFTPGKLAGKPVQVYYTLPINFQIQQ